ncbi:MAG: molybdate ABC transporter permease subunit [Candidatus Sericytochromatia bacterium]|nr:molybdate ABC transporter permease subunit [Candidatus Sericytochromatia bacterium]
MPLDALWLTLKLASLTTAVLVGLGAPLAWRLARWRGRTKPFVEALLALPLVLPPTVLGFYMLLAMGQRGPLGQAWQVLFAQPLAFSFAGLWLASLLFSLPFALQPMLAGFSRIDPELVEAAENAGASPWQVFRHVAWPLGGSGIAGGAALCFAHTLGEFGVALMVGGNIPGETQTIAIALYDLTEALRFDLVHGLALGLLLFSYLVLLGIAWSQRGSMPGESLGR